MKTTRKQLTESFLREITARKQIETVLKEVRDSDCEGEEQKTAVLKTPVHNFDIVLNPGEIRLLSQPEQLTYAVLFPWDWEHFLVIPYSHYRYPASDEEFTAENGNASGLYRQILQPWNSRTISKPLLMRSWKMGEISSKEMSRIKQMLGYCWFRDKLSKELIGQSAFPIRNCLDPRAKILNKEMENMLELDQKESMLESLIGSLDISKDTMVTKTEPLSFSLPAECLLEAASGNNTLTEVFAWNNWKTDFLTGLEVENFSTASTWKSYCWFEDENSKLSEYLWKTVLFVHKKTNELLGTSLVEPDDNGIMLNIRNVDNDSPYSGSCLSPSDLRIILV